MSFNLVTNMSVLNINGTPFPMSQDSINKIFVQNTNIHISMPGMTVDQISMMLCTLTIGSLDLILKQNWQISHLNMVYLFLSNMTNLTDMTEELYEILVENESYEMLTTKLSAGKPINLENYIKNYKDKIIPVRLELIKNILTLNHKTRESIIKTGILGDVSVARDFIKLFDSKEVTLGNPNKGTHVNGIWIEHNKCPIKYKPYNFSFIISEKSNYKMYYHTLLNIIFGKEDNDVIDLCVDEDIIDKKFKTISVVKDDDDDEEYDDDEEEDNDEEKSPSKKCKVETEKSSDENSTHVSNPHLYTSEELIDACHLLEAMYSQGMPHVPSISFDDVSSDTLNILAPFNKGILKHTHSKTALNEGHIALFTNYAHMAISRELFEMSKFMSY